MKKVALLLAVCIVMLPVAAVAQDIYAAKCVACHGADGKKNAKKDLSSDAVQSLSDDEMVKFLTTNPIHKSKVTADEAKEAVKAVRALKK